MTDREQAALEYIQQKLQQLDGIHQQALKALNAILGKEHLQKWKKQVVQEMSESISAAHARQFAKDWLDTPYVAGDVFDELEDDVDMCRRHLKRLAKAIQQDGLPKAPSG